MEASDKPVAGAADQAVEGSWVDLYGERYYAIRNVDRMAPFFVSMVSNDDHWLFASSTGGLTAGRVSPETAMFPYITVDRIHDSSGHTGCLTRVRVHADGDWLEWDPFSNAQNGRYAKTRNLYKNLLGNKLSFEEINHDLGLAFRYTWQTSDRFGFVRDAELENLSDRPVELELADGLQNILPAGTPRFTQTNSSNLVDAYKWTELDRDTGLALFTLYSGITDRAEPCESLKANTVYAIGLDKPRILISTEQLKGFASGAALAERTLTRGIRGAFILNTRFGLEPGGSRHWQIVANSEVSQSEVVALRHRLRDRGALADDIRASINEGSLGLTRIMASGDGFQATAEENVTAHHYSNVLFNILRGGVFSDQYQVSTHDLRQTLRSFNKAVYRENADLLQSLPERLTAPELMARVREADSPQLERLCQEYLPITFGRRHGDPSRPWNQFAIRLRDGNGDPLLSYEGNWRDIFQNWEALAFSFPEFVESMIAKFVNASTMDGYNPYRITKEGIDWEVEDPEDPWSYIGYWGDHQIIYLQKLLELSRDFHPVHLSGLLHKPIFSYANVPYRIRDFDALIKDPKTTVDYDDALAERIEERLESIGADGKLVLDGEGAIYQVTLLEKLMVPLLSKLGNLVVDGGIWMNTQRPEWNDANNALVGQGLSMVTLYYLRRYVRFFDELLAGDDADTAELSAEVATWTRETAEALRNLQPALSGNAVIDGKLRLESLTALGQAASRYRLTVYGAEGFSGKTSCTTAELRDLLSDALAAIDQSIRTNRREDGLYNAYNLLDLSDTEAGVERLYPMLEGQVSALSAGSIPPDVAADVLESLFASEVYRPDQETFMLYPDRDLPTFLAKNVVAAVQIDAIPLLREMVEAGDERVVLRDADGEYRFNADFVNVHNLKDMLDNLVDEYGDAVGAAGDRLCGLYEETFNHQAFTGRSGTMFGFEGLGCVYWHMVGKLLLAVQENYFQALDGDADASVTARLGRLYYRVRNGIGFNKTPEAFGAFPADPYSHTPKHAGAQQPGMTGQVKEEILTRFGELGLRVENGSARIDPRLLRRREFATDAREFSYIDVDDSSDSLALAAGSIAFTWCQVPFVYSLGDDAEVTVTYDDGSQTSDGSLALPAEICPDIFTRSGRVRRVEVRIPAGLLLTD